MLPVPLALRQERALLQPLLHAAAGRIAGDDSGPKQKRTKLTHEYTYNYPTALKYVTQDKCTNAHILIMPAFCQTACTAM